MGRRNLSGQPSPEDSPRGEGCQDAKRAILQVFAPGETR